MFDSTFTLTLIMKPLQDAIENHPNSIKVSMSSNKNFNFDFLGDKNIVYLVEGSVMLNRIKDNVLLFEIKSPFIIGLEKIFSGTNHYYMTPNEGVSLIILSHNDALELFDKEKLWKDISKLISYYIMLHENRSHNLAENRNIYDIIRFNLEAIWALPKSERNVTSLFEYILKRHPISRSSVAKIIRELNNGNYITTSRGILKDLQKLPSKF